MIALILFPVLANSQQRDTTQPKKYELTVKEAVDLAYKNVVELKNANLDYRIQEAMNKEIIGQALPQVSGTISSAYYLQHRRSFFHSRMKVFTRY